jgi:hypothetical protein
MTGGFEKNRTALAQRYPLLADTLSTISQPPWLRIEAGKGGAPTAFVASGSGRVALHSQYDPRREAEKLADRVPQGATVVVEGFGLGYHLEAVLNRRQPFRVLVLDLDGALLAAAMRHRELSGLLTDPRIVISLGATEAEIQGHIGELFQPLFSRNLESFPLSPWARLHQEWFASRRRWAAAAAESVLDDVAAQGRFGLRWTRNSIVNLAIGGVPLLGRPEGAPHRREAEEKMPLAEAPAIVTAAGPSLPKGLKSVAGGKAHIFATDTSLPSLAHFGIRPQAVFSIDCQQISYHHFFRKVEDESLSFFEAASPPSLLRRAARPKLFLGEHPFHAYLSRRLPGLLKIDTKGGNVTFAAVDYLRQSGYRRIEILGADYGYPRLEGYTNPSFLSHHYQSIATRLRPLEGLHTSFALDRLPEGERTTAVLQGYKSNLHSYVDRHGGTMEETGAGRISLRFELGPGDPAPGTQAAGDEIDRVVEGYASALGRLDAETVVERHLTGGAVSQESRELLFTLMPVAQAISVAFPEESGGTLIHRARDWTLRLLSAFYPTAAGEATSTHRRPDR